jgi:hypothetical protein
LGKHEIATVQTTSIDPEAGLIRLTTVLAHSSGEWVSSDWPVCPISETAAPHKMGAALTYARRYALFTLVGIAGEDDLDAPDLPVIKSDGGAAGPSNPEKLNGHAAAAAIPTNTPPANGSHRKPKPSVPMLTAEASAALRHKLVNEIAGLSSAEIAVEWARGSIAAKNTLTTGDAGDVEAAFRDRMQLLEFQAPIPEPAAEDLVAVPADIGSPLGSAGPDNHSSEETRPQALEPQSSKQQGPRASGDGTGERVHKSVLTIAEPRRYRNKEHLRFVAQQACLVCGRMPSDPHHLRFTQPRALGRKVSDEFVTPLCRIHHREVHRAGDERSWWKQAGIDPVRAARKLWRKTRPRDGSLQPNLRTAPTGLDAPSSSDGNKAPV